MDDQARNAPLGQRADDKPRHRGPVCLGYGLLLSWLVATPVVAQNINETVTIEDLGFTQPLLGGARPTALAGAYAAMGDDAHALIYNPAGLVGVTEPQVQLGFQHQRWTLKNSFYGNTTDVDYSATSFDDFALAFPIPTVQGRLVLAAGVYRMYSSDLDIAYSGLNTDTATDDEYILQQSGSTYSYNFGGAIDVSPRVSVGLNVFFLYGNVTALTQFTFDKVPPPPVGELASETLVDDAEFTVSGIGAAIGIMFQPAKPLRFGFTFGTPTPINIRGDAVQQDALYYSAAPDEFYTDSFVIETDYTLPFYVEAGVSLSTPRFLVTLEAEYSNWEEAEIQGRQVKDSDLNAIFREVLDLRAGLEINLGPVSLRGGLAYTPYPLEYLQADRIEGTQLTEAVVDNQSGSATVGIGLRVAKGFTIDAALQYESGSRSIPTYTDDREMYRGVLAASFGGF